MEDAAGAGADELPPLSAALDAQTDVIDTQAQRELILRQQRLIHHQLQQVDVQHGGVKPEFESWLNAQPCNLGGILPMQYNQEQIELMVWQYKATHGLLPVQQSSHASRSLQSDAAQRHQQEFSQAGQQQVSPAIPYGQQMGELHKQYSVPHGQGQHVQQPSSLVEPDDAQRPQQEHGQADQHQMPGQHQMQYHATLPTLPLKHTIQCYWDTRWRRWATTVQRQWVLAAKRHRVTVHTAVYVLACIGHKLAAVSLVTSHPRRLRRAAVVWCNCFWCSRCNAA